MLRKGFYGRTTANAVCAFDMKKRFVLFSEDRCTLSFAEASGVRERDADDGKDGAIESWIGNIQ